MRDTTTDVISYKYSLIVEGKKESRRGGRRRYIESDSESERREMGESQSGIYSTHNSLTCLSCDTRKSTTCPSHIHMRLFWQFENNVRGNKKKKLAFLLLHIFFAHSDTKVDFVFQVFFTVRSPVLVVCRCAPYSNVALPNVPFKVKYFSIFLSPTKAKGFYQFCRFFSPPFFLCRHRQAASSLAKACQVLVVQTVLHFRKTSSYEGNCHKQTRRKVFAFPEKGYWVSTPKI